MPFRCHNTFANLSEAFYNKQKPKAFGEPFLVHLNEGLAEDLGLSINDKSSEEWARLFCGKDEIPGSDPLAMVYAGHQFGGYSPQLGDGRGLLLAEVLDNKDQKWDLHLKGAGLTPYSRMGDGRAVLRSCIREYLGSEALHHLNIPTTRALSLVGSYMQIQRESVEYAAMMTRVAKTHIRLGHFEFFYYSDQPKELEELMQYAIHDCYPEHEGKVNQEQLFFREVLERTAKMIAHWQSSGFTHGVMNTDNLNIMGETFDFGPFAFMERYDPNFIPNHSDHQGRYSYKEQSSIGLWNMNCFANCFIPFVDREILRDELSRYEGVYLEAYISQMKAKFGFAELGTEVNDFIFKTLELMDEENLDYTIFFRQLSEEGFQFQDLIEGKKSYRYEEWQGSYDAFISKLSISSTERSKAMKAINPKFIPRTHLLQKAIEAAENDDYSEIDKQLKIYQNPFDELPQFEEYAQAPPQTCSTVCLTCSS